MVFRVDQNQPAGTYVFRSCQPAWCRSLGRLATSHSSFIIGWTHVQSLAGNPWHVEGDPFFSSSRTLPSNEISNNRYLRRPTYRQQPGIGKRTTRHRKQEADSHFRAGFFLIYESGFPQEPCRTNENKRFFLRHGPLFYRGDVSSRKL